MEHCFRFVRNDLNAAGLKSLAWPEQRAHGHAIGEGGLMGFGVGVSDTEKAILEEISQALKLTA